MFNGIWESPTGDALAGGRNRWRLEIEGDDCIWYEYSCRRAHFLTRTKLAPHHLDRSTYIITRPNSLELIRFLLSNERLTCAPEVIEKTFLRKIVLNPSTLTISRGRDARELMVTWKGDKWKVSPRGVLVFDRAIDEQYVFSLVPPVVAEPRREGPAIHVQFGCAIASGEGGLAVHAASSPSAAQDIYTAPLVKTFEALAESGLFAQPSQMPPSAASAVQSHQLAGEHPGPK